MVRQRLTQEKIFSVVPWESRNIKAEGKRHRHKRDETVCQTKMRMNVWAIKFYCLI